MTTPPRDSKRHRPSPDEMGELASLYGGCRAVERVRRRVSSPLIEDKDRPLFAHVVRRMSQRFDENLQVEYEAVRQCFDDISCADETLFDLVREFKSRHGGQDQALALLDRHLGYAERFCEGIILAFDVLQETFNAGSSESEQRAQTRSLAREEIRLLLGSHAKPNRAGIMLALPALWATAAMARTGVSPRYRQFAVRERAAFRQEHFPGQGFLAVVEIQGVFIPGFEEATRFIWKERDKIDWPPVPQSVGNVGGGSEDGLAAVARHVPSASMIVQIDGAKQWAVAALRACEAHSQSQGRLKYHEEQFIEVLLGRILRDADKNQIVSKVIESSDTLARTDLFVLVSRILDISNKRIDEKLFSHRGHPLDMPAIGRLIERNF